MSNKTKEKLKGTPFESAEELKLASQDISLQTWRKLESARIKKDLLEKDEFKFYTEIFKKGMLCQFGEKNNNIVHICIDKDNHIKITINEELKHGKNQENLLGVLVQSMSSSFLSNYLKTIGVADETPFSLNEGT